MDPDKPIFYGSIVALVTPMDDAGAIDFAALEALVDWHVESGSHGLVIMGTTGESSLVSEQEHYQTVACAIAQAAGRLKIIAGCGSASTAKAVSLAKMLNPLKPDGFLCVTPYYVKPTQAGLLAHFSAVADACDAPVLLYNVPGRTSCDLENDTVIQLANHANIVGLKDATGELARLQQLQSKLPPGFCLLSGDDESAFDYVEQGGHGVITVSGNICPRAVAQWNHLLLTRVDGDRATASALFSQLGELNQVLFIEANPIPVKWALAEMGRVGQSIRLPLTLPEPVSQQRIKQVLNAIATDFSLE